MNAFWWRHGVWKAIAMNLVDCWIAAPSFALVLDTIQQYRDT
jgi:hypothetical protein